MSTMYKDLVNNYGTSQSIEEFAKKGQLVGAMNSKTIWEVWNYNKLDYGDRYCSGLLFWYHNCPVRQVCARMWIGRWNRRLHYIILRMHWSLYMRSLII